MEDEVLSHSGGGELVGARVIDPRAPLSAQDIRDTVIIKAGEVFLLSDLQGNVPVGNRNGLGLYHGDTRFLSGLELVIEGLPPTILLSTDHGPSLSEQVLTNPHLVSGDARTITEQTIGIRRYRRIVGHSVHEALVFDNLNVFPLILDVAIRLEADFADMFDVRGLVVREVPRAALEPDGDGWRVFRRRGDDGVTRGVRVRFSPEPSRIDGTTWRYELALGPRASQRLTARYDILPQGTPCPTGPTPRRTKARGPAINSSSEPLNLVMRRAQDDLTMLTCGEGDARFIAAGVPWYSALFGRDAIIAALQHLWLDPSLARSTLRLLARRQGKTDDPWRDEEPGKILHELRRGELARMGHVPFDPYYGTIDATPLWVCLLGEYHRVSGDVGLVADLRDELEAALQWIEAWGDRDGDGFIEYQRRSGSGLVNQGWKDSWDGVVHADGALVEPPVALVEVQAYAYAARREAARLLRVLGQPGRAADLEAAAERLRERFEAAFWMEDEGFYALALDGDKRQARAVTSNPGHALWCGIVSPGRAHRVAKRLLEEDLFSGWGVRTLSTRSPRFNPAGYHVGTVWPHDNGLAALGLKRYGDDDGALTIVEALLAAAQHFPGQRLPELFCGFARSGFGVPVRYPVACSPQAWAATTPSALLQAVLGVQPDATARELRIVRPRLPAGVEWLEIQRLPVGAAEVDLRYERIRNHVAVDVTAMRGDVRVAFVDRWEEE